MLQKIKAATGYLIAYVFSHYLVILFTITTSLKLIFINAFILGVSWPTNNSFDGILMSIAISALLFAPMLLMHKTKNKNTIFGATVISIILLIDVVYYSYFTSLPSVSLIGSAGEANGVMPAIAALLHPGLILLFADIIIVVIFRRFLRVFIETKTAFLPNINNLTNLITTSLVVVFFWLSIQSVGFKVVDDVINKGYDNTSTAQSFSVLGAHAVDIARFIIQETTVLSDSETAELKAWVKANRPTIVASNYTGVAKEKNIIMIQVESLGGFVIGQTINGKEITPNLNKLAETSQFFPNNRFIMGAGHTSDADLVANTSFFPLDDAATFVRYGRDDFTSLPKIMSQLDYSVYAYHGFNRHFWNRSTAITSLGYQKFYASDNYSDGAKINMGLNDGTFLTETADYIADQPKPSFSYVITLTSHVPFQITSETAELGLNKADYPDQVAGYLENINYTDRMLGKFFDKLKAKNLYEDSLIVVYGDHVPVLGKFTAGSITYDPKSVQGKEAPLFFKLPNTTAGKTYQNKGTSLDIMPTILDAIGVKSNFLMFGQSLFANDPLALKVCKDQLVAFNTTDNCEAMLQIEKQKSAQIIRYNQFGNITE